MTITIGTPDRYWFALLQQRRIAGVFLGDKIIARAFYAEQGPAPPLPSLIALSNGTAPARRRSHTRRTPRSGMRSSRAP